ncbi:MAG: hypothetical protein M9894_17610 [Planctomycetes bacterium]|nr:hypothetical protein [Planctomycetota bacterium]
MSFDDEVISVTIADDEGVHAVATFTSRVETTRRDQEALLTAKEREVFEDTLLGALCRQIHTRTMSARELVRHMDRAMRARQMMSSKMTLGIRWELINDLTKEQRDTLRLLEHDPSHLDPERLDALRRHFSAAVKQTRAADPSRSYRDILGSVLDYRQWRHFTLLLVDPDGEDTPLTRQRHAKLSTGEKAISLHMPLFAAAHAQFASGRPTCPHLIALDEAFAAIDAKGKPELLGLTVKFDLDLFLTGYELWVTHASVPAAAHYELLRVEHEHTVASLLILWDGRELHEGEEAVSRLRSLVPQE